MAFSAMKERYRNKINEVVLGATKEGGTVVTPLLSAVKVRCPFLHFEGEIPNRPIVALEVWDVAPTDWHESFHDVFW